jgi:hypothetical protein
MHDPRFAKPSDAALFRRELQPALAKAVTTEAKVLITLRWVMNQIPRIEARSANSSWEMVELGRSGGGLICGGMADIFREALLANGIPARRVILQRDIFNVDDSHVTVEAWVDGRWRLYDPTFHIALRSNGERIGAHEAREHFLKRATHPVEIEFLGDVTYPARVDKYYIRYEPLFDHVFVEVERGVGVLRALPVIGVWLAPQRLYQFDAVLGMRAEESYRIAYYMTLVALPIANILLLLALWVRWRQSRHLATRQ